MHRDTTRALALIREIADEAKGAVPGIMPKLQQVQEVLTDMDARTGRRDPSKRKRPAKKGNR